jgi:hypothetical protein
VYVTPHEEQVMKVPFKRTATPDGFVVEGAELIGSIKLPASIDGFLNNIPEGGALGFWPVNPLHNDGMRVARELAQYDQWQLEEVIYHYEPTCPTTTPGALWMAFFADVAETPFQNGTTAVARDFAVRPGAAEVQPFRAASCRVSKTLFKWYMTRTEGPDAIPVDPGFFAICAATEMPAAASGTATPLGVVWMTYRIRVRVPTYERPSPLVFSFPTGTCFFDGVARINRTAVQNTSPGFAPPVAFANPNTIGWFIIGQINDTGGLTAWRQWATGDEGPAVLMSVGMIVFFRANLDASGVAYWNYYPSFEAAARGIADAGAPDPNMVGAFCWTSSAAAAANGFRIWGINGCHSDGAN